MEPQLEWFSDFFGRFGWNGVWALAVAGCLLWAARIAGKASKVLLNAHSRFIDSVIDTNKKTVESVDRLRDAATENSEAAQATQKVVTAWGDPSWLRESLENLPVRVAEKVIAQCPSHKATIDSRSSSAD